MLVLRWDHWRPVLMIRRGRHSCPRGTWIGKNPAEVVSAGRTGCEYIRGWLEYCLARYDNVIRDRPELIENSQ